MRTALVWAGLAAAAHSAEPWRKVSSSHFEMFTQSGEGRARDLVRQFEQVHDLFVSLGAKRRPDAPPVRLILFSSEREFRPYASGDYAAAYYIGGGERDYIVMRRDAADLFPLAVHEYTHLVVRHTGLDLPPWLNEGLADLYSTMKPGAGKVVIGEPPPGRVRQLRDEGRLDLAALASVDRQSPRYNEKLRAGAFYAGSWALVHMLALDARYRAGFAKLFELVATGQSVADATGAVYGKTTAEVERDLAGYARQPRFATAEVAIQLAPRAQRPEARAAEPLETGLALADLLYLLRRRTEARAALAELARAHPEDWEIEVALSRLAWRDDDDAGVKRHFARAIELGTTNAKVYADYAMILRAEGGRNEEATAMLRRAVELDPELDEARYALGMAEFHAGRWEEAIGELSRVKKVTGERSRSYHRALAWAHEKLGRRDEARRYAAAAGDPDLAALLARGPDPPVLRERIEKFEGTLEAVECEGAAARFEFLTGGRRVSLAVRDPGSVTIRNAKGQSVEFPCGPQNATAVSVVFLPEEGVIRSIEFR
ncbi:MAG: tetratricopeptide repeat protein [Bryobacteraceae bacterium]